MLKVVLSSNFLFSVKISLPCFLRKLFLPPIHVLAFFEKDGCFERYHHFAQNVTREQQRKRTAGEVINERGGADYTGISRRRQGTSFLEHSHLKLDEFIMLTYLWAGNSTVKMTGEFLGVLPPYRHLTVNQSTNFVDPITHACTNSVEGRWKHVKRKLSAVNGSSAELLTGYLDEYEKKKKLCKCRFTNPTL